MIHPFACTSALLFLAFHQAIAQRPFDRDSRGGRGQELKLKAGDSLPDASGFNAEGKPFRLHDLKGHHTVLVFGCLT